MSTVPAPSATPRIAIPPAIGEEHQWRPQRPEIFSGAEVRRQTGSYQSIIPAAIADWKPELGSEDLADLMEASSALSRFDSHALARLGVQHPAVLPMSAILLRTESASSSQIEQLTTSARQLALAEIDEGDRANAAVVIGNVRAMESAIRLADGIDENSILAMHRELLSRQAGFEDEAGRYRTELVWIGNRDTAGPRGADFIAPQAERLPSAMRDLLDFIARQDIPGLVQVAVAHAQFETLHPFVDGNGRTGRALAQSLLRHRGLTPRTIVPISAGLLTDVDSYFSALGAFRAGDAGPIIRRFADAARFAAVTGEGLVDALADRLSESLEALAGLRPQSAAWRVLPLLIGQPVVNSRYLQRTLQLNDVTAVRALDALTERGVLVERTGRARNRIWQHNGVLEVLDDYAAEVRRTPSRR